MNIYFSPDGHVYRLDGERVPSVTQVINTVLTPDAFDGVPDDALERARQFGTHVHAACAMVVDGTLDRDSLDPALAPYVEQFEHFLATTRCAVIASEKRVAHAALRYAGTLDLLVRLRGRLAVIDIKTGLFHAPSVGCQTAAYAQALASCAEHRPRDRYCLQLGVAGGPDGYRLHALDDRTDWHAFHAALTVYHWRSRNEQ